MGFRVNQPWIEAVWFWASHLTSLSLGFHIHKTEVILSSQRVDSKAPGHEKPFESDLCHHKSTVRWPCHHHYHNHFSLLSTLSQALTLFHEKDLESLEILWWYLFIVIKFSILTICKHTVEWHWVRSHYYALIPTSISGNSPSHKTETQHPFDTNSLFPALTIPWQPSFYFISLWIWLLWCK